MGNLRESYGLSRAAENAAKYDQIVDIHPLLTNTEGGTDRRGDAARNLLRDRQTAEDPRRKNISRSSSAESQWVDTWT